MIITLGVLAGRLLSASLVAFGFARIRFIGRDVIFILVLGTMMVPLISDRLFETADPRRMKKIQLLKDLGA